MRYGSLFTGAGGLDLAVQMLWPDAELVWWSEVDEHASASFARHTDAPNLGDITAIDWSEVEPVDVLVGGFPCFPAGTPISTRDGVKLIEDVDEGDEVLTHLGRFKPVVTTMRRDGAPLVRVVAQGEPGLDCTPEHPFYAKDGKDGEPEWVDAQDLTLRHRVAVVTDDLSDTDTEGAAFWYLVGRWLGDGWTVTHKRTSTIPQGNRGSRVDSQVWKALVCCAHIESDELAAKIEEAGFHATPAVEETVTKFHISSKELVEFLEPFGEYAHGKKIPEFVFTRSAAELEALWSGWVDADGWATDRFEQVTTVSESLARGMQRVAEAVWKTRVSLYFHATKNTTNIEGRTVNQRDQWQLRLSFNPRIKADADGILWCPVRSVTPQDGAAEVFNFEVADDNSYVAARHVVHNCQDLSHAGKRAGINADRSGLWFHMLAAMNALRPSLALLENVAGIYTATGDDDELDVDRDPLDGRSARPARALDVVLGSLADDGWDAVWGDYRASDVGACHQRRRWFCVAWDPAGVGVEGWRRTGDGDAREVVGAGISGRPGEGPRTADGVSLLATPQARDHKGIPGDGFNTKSLPRDVSLLPTPVAHDDGKSPEAHMRMKRNMPGGPRGSITSLSVLARAGFHQPGELLPTPRATQGGSNTETQNLLPTPTSQAAKHGAPTDYELSDERAHIDNFNLWVVVGKHDRWGEYGPAIDRHARVAGRPPPPPTDEKGRLSADFVEWMMFWPPGWTQGSRSQRLKQCGNGVAPLQAAHAYAQLLERAAQAQEVAA